MHELVPPLLPSSGTARVKVLPHLWSPWTKTPGTSPGLGKREVVEECGTTDPGSPRAGPRRVHQVHFRPSTVPSGSCSPYRAA
eukprot:1302228-Prymnesium_polylepis.1